MGSESPKGLLKKVSAQRKKLPEKIRGFLLDMYQEILAMRQKLGDIPSTNFNLGLNHLRKGNLKDASMRFWMVTKASPEFGEAYYYWGRCLTLEDKKDEALEKLQKAQALLGDLPQVSYAITLLTKPREIKEIPVEVVYERVAPITDNVGNVIGHPDEEEIRKRRRIMREQLLKASFFYIKDKNPLYTVLDIECGDGFCGKQLKKKSMLRGLIGIEPAVARADIARSIRVKEEAAYDDVLEIELREFFENNETYEFDLILMLRAANYFGALDDLFVSLHKALEPSGRLSFIISNTSHADYLFDPNKEMFHHSTLYTESTLQKHGFEILGKEEITFKDDSIGTIYVAERH